MRNTQIQVIVMFDGALDAATFFINLILEKYVIANISRSSGQQDKICYNASGESNIVSNGLDGNEP